MRSLCYPMGGGRKERGRGEICVKPMGEGSSACQPQSFLVQAIMENEHNDNQNDDYVNDNVHDDNVDYNENVVHG